MAKFLSLVVVAALALSCGESDGPEATGATDVAVDSAADSAVVDAGAATGPTWHGEISAVIQNRCGSCHREGGIGPFRLDRPEDWEVMGQPSLSAMEAGTMPPWPADPTCGKFLHRGDMPKAEIAQVKTWLDNERPIGKAQESGKKAAKPVEITPTHKLPMPGPFTPPKGTLDTYRCFLLPLDTSVDRFLKASQVVPGSDKLVHHVLVYSLEGDHITKAEAADKKESELGYTCFGGPLPNTGGGGLLDFTSGFPNQLAAWVPGLQPRVFPDDYAIRIKKGSRVVMQVHYNVAAGETEPDQTRLDLVLTETPPKRLVVTRPLIIRNLDIQPGDKSAPHEQTFRYYGEGEVRVHSLTPHMHLLGSSFESKIHRAGGDSECAVRVPKWDFGWQQGYGRPIDDPIVLKSGDGLSLRCVYDNSAANQPLVGGKQQTPKKVTWGDGSLDEMCLLYLDMSMPYEPGLAAGAPPCQGIDTCQKTCDKSSPTSCVYGCQSTEPVCGTCVIGKLISCAGINCAAPMLSAQNCLTNCLIGSLMLEANAQTCLETQCKTKWEKVQACLDPKIAKGECNKQLKACGVGF
ncbi:MAG: hypothetical protein KC502_07885 [Myxococcales bacterium]|nr:hypothetical protein [Myxococcales bacterium]